MVKFEPVDASQIDNLRAPHRGRVSYPILKGFLETGHFLAMLDRTGLQQSNQSLYSSLGAYIRSHNMPIRLFQRQGNMYLMRLDIDEKGNEIDNWEQARDVDTEYAATPINQEEVAKRYQEEKDQTTK